MKLKNPTDIERRSRLIYSIYRNGFTMKRSEIALNAGYTPEYISRLISGERRVTDDAIHNLAPVLGVREAYLLGQDDFMTQTDLDKALQKADAFSANINQAAATINFVYTGCPPHDMTDITKCKSHVQDFINDKVISKERLFINTKEEYYVEISEDEYKDFCDDISSYIQFRIQQFYKKHSKKTIT